MTTEHRPLFEPRLAEPPAATAAEPEPNAPAKLRPINRQQLTLAPVDVEELIPADHKARAILGSGGPPGLSDYEQLQPALEQIEEDLGQAPRQVLVTGSALSKQVSSQAPRLSARQAAEPLVDPCAS